MKIKLTDDLWASALAQKLADEIGLPAGSLWVPPTARRLKSMAEHWTREELEDDLRRSLRLEIAPCGKGGAA